MQAIGAGGQKQLTSAVEVQIREILEMAERMIVISERGFETCDDDGCLLLNGMVRECAYRLRDAAEREQAAHAVNARDVRGPKQP
jgi:hypothetical protein